MAGLSQISFFGQQPVSGLNVSEYLTDVSGVEGGGSSCVDSFRSPGGAWGRGETEGARLSLSFPGSCSLEEQLGFVPATKTSGSARAGFESQHCASPGFSGVHSKAPYFFPPFVCKLQVCGGHTLSWVLHWLRALSGAWLIPHFPGCAISWLCDPE